MVRFYAWSSVLAPLLGMLFSMFSHRYAYMNASVGLAILFVFACFGHLKNERANKPK